MEYKEPIPKQDYKVLVRCFTFNQSKYIEDAFNGFVMQTTKFPYVCVIVDDCSTDGEQEVIKAYLNKEFDMSVGEHYETEYANITIAPHKTNPNCTFVVYLLKYNHYSKKQPKWPYFQQWREHCEYEAKCEGDDYWLNPLKLQKQVDILDANHELSFCFNAFVMKFVNGTERDIHYFPKSRTVISQDEMLRKEKFPKIVTIMYDIKKYGKGYMAWCKGKPPIGDFPMCLDLLSKGKAAYIDEVMSAYRLSADSSWTSAINKSLSKRIEHRRRVNCIYKYYDEYTHYVYSDLLNKMERKRNFIFCINVVKLFVDKITFGLVSSKLEPIIRKQLNRNKDV